MIAAGAHLVLLALLAQEGAQAPGPPMADGPPSRHYGEGSRRPPGGWMRGGMQLGPPGRWWDDPQFAQDLALTPDQQTRMDAIFEANRTQLQAGFRALRQEETQMEALAHGRSPDEGQLDAEIDRIAQARAALEKVSTHMLLEIRRLMSPDQITRLEAHRPPEPPPPAPR